MKINIFWSSDNIYSKLYTTENILGPGNLIYVTPRVTSSTSSATTVEEALQFLIFESPKLQSAAVAGNEAFLEMWDAGSPWKYTFIYLHLCVCHFSHRRHSLSLAFQFPFSMPLFETIFLAICLSFEVEYINCLGLSGNALLNQQYTTNKYAHNYLQPITCVCRYTCFSFPFLSGNTGCFLPSFLSSVGFLNPVRLIFISVFYILCILNKANYLPVCYC